MIYIVDDDPIQTMILSQLLKMVAADLKFKVFGNGTEVLDAINDGGVPEVILLDINMPIMNGWEFLEEYKSHNKSADVYILSSSSDEKDINKSGEYACVKGYFSKPTSTDNIREILQVSAYEF